MAEETETTEETGAEATETEETQVTGTEAETTASDDWRASIEDADLRKVADRFTSPADMAKAVADLRKRESNSIRIPGKDAGEEEITAYRKALGVPETPEGYEFTVPEGHELNDADKAFQAWAGETFHSNQISAEQAKGLSDAWNTYVATAQQALIDADKAFADESEAALKAEWPGQEYDRNKAFADRAARDGFAEDFEEVSNIETKDGRFVLDHPAFLRMLAKFGREMDEGRLGGVMTDGDKDNIETQINEMQAKIDKATAQNDRQTAQDLYIKQQDLYRKLHGSAPIVGSEGRSA